MAVGCGTDVEIEGEEQVAVFSSSEWAERGFCSKCGTNLFYRLKQNQEFYIAAGIFTDPTGLVLDHQVFIDEKPDYYDFANETKDMTGAEVFARFTSS